MPNIKVYGVKKNAEESINDLIKELFKFESYADDVVITVVRSEVKTLKGESRPYLQLELDCMENYEQKVELLKKIGFDIQVVKLHEFIPGSSSVV